MATHYRPRGKLLRHKFEPGEMMTPASELHDSLKGRPVVVMGQAYSLNYVDLEKIRPFLTIGCNRCLRPDSHVKWHPDYYVCVDRDPYAQELKRIKAFKGIRVLSEMLFDPNNMHKKSRLRTHWAPLQPYPDFPWYGFRPVSTSRPRHTGRHVYTGWPAWDRTLGTGIIPSFCVNLDLLVPGAANVAYSMFQIAAALGANPIGIVGVDLSWESGKKSHSFGSGDGKSLGAFALNPRHSLPFFAAGVRECWRMGVEVYNLSPKGVLSPTIPALKETAFYQRFGQYARGDLLYPGQQQQSASVRSGRPRSRAATPHNRYKPSAEAYKDAVRSAHGRTRTRRGTAQVAKRKAEAARLARSRRKARGRSQGA